MMKLCPTIVVTTGLILSSCTAPLDTTELDHPMGSSTGEVKFIMSPESGELKIRDAVAIAKVLRRYRDLDAAEKALVKLAVRRKFDGLVALEYRKLEQANAHERQRIRRIPDVAERKQADDALTAKLLAEAARRVSAQLGGLLAVPMKTSTSQSVVAFARVVSDDIKVADAAYELDAPQGKIGPQTKIAAADDLQDKGLQAIRQGQATAQVLAGTSISIQ